MRRDAFTSEPVEILDRGPERDRAADVRRAGFEARRRFAVADQRDLFAVWREHRVVREG